VSEGLSDRGTGRESLPSLKIQRAGARTSPQNVKEREAGEVARQWFQA
jgi:hypothetical protein